MRLLGIAALLATAATPCLWDSDTLADELRGLPEAFDLVTGRWHRHSDAYYRERTRRLGNAAALTIAEYDDLAVAHEHLGERDQAIAVMLRKGQALAQLPEDPAHRYRYHANLGTFYAHAGRFDEALAELHRAVAINKDAHFGRERYQIELIEYIAAARDHPEHWAYHGFLRFAGHDVHNAHFSPPPATAPPGDWPREPSAIDWRGAYEAVAGMLRFGGLEGAELYRALGDLLLHKQHLHLAWWSYRRAIERGHPAAGRLRAYLQGIVEHQREAERHQPNGNEPSTEALYREGRASADRWLLAFQELEAAALAEGEDVGSDAVLRRLLAAADAREPRPEPPSRWTRQLWFMLVVGCFLIAVGVAWFARRRR